MCGINKIGDNMKAQMLFFLLAMVSLSLFADGVQPNGMGTETNPYQIEILDNLLWISTNSSSWVPDSYFIQTANIDASDTQNWNDGEGFSPIGWGGDRFRGNYNGQNYIIDGLFINRPEVDQQGLFGFVEYGTIENLGLENSNITGNSYSAGVIGWISDSIMNNCYNTGTIQGIWYIGGLAGYCYCSEISNSYNSGNISGEWYVGGIFGADTEYHSTISDSYNSGTIQGDKLVGGLIGLAGDASITNCYNTGDVVGSYEYTGGLLGSYSDMNSYLEYCYNTGSVTGNYYVGGIIGSVTNRCNIFSCYSSGNVQGNIDVGGFYGKTYNNVITKNCYSTSNVSGVDEVGGFAGLNTCLIENSYSTGSIFGSTFTGGFVGSNWESADNFTLNCFWDMETSGQQGSVEGTGKTTNEMKDIATYTSLETDGLEVAWDFIDNPFDDIGTEDFWDIDSETNNEYPYLINSSSVGNDDENDVAVSLSKSSIKNYPNPFNPTTTIQFELTSNNQASIEIFNIKGQKIVTLGNKFYNKGLNSVIWNGKNKLNQTISSGVYYYKLKVDGKFQQIGKCLLLK